MAGKVVFIDHPLVQHKLTLMRRKETSPASFRRLMSEIGTLLGYEATRDLPLEVASIETPLAPMMAPLLAGKKLCFVSILRAGIEQHAGDGQLKLHAQLLARIGRGAWRKLRPAINAADAKVAPAAVVRNGQRRIGGAARGSGAPMCPSGRSRRRRNGASARERGYPAWDN